MNLNTMVFKLDEKTGNFTWYVNRYIEKLVEEKLKTICYLKIDSENQREYDKLFNEIKQEECVK